MTSAEEREARSPRPRSVGRCSAWPASRAAGDRGGGQAGLCRRLRDEDGLTLPQIVERAGLTRSTLYQHLPPRPATALTVAVPAGQYACQVDVTKSVEPAELVAHDQPAERAVWADVDDQGILQSVRWPTGYRPVCTRPTSGPRERNARVRRELVVVAVAQPCGCGVDDQPPHSKRVHPPPVERLLTCLLRRGWCCGT